MQKNNFSCFVVLLLISAIGGCSRSIDGGSRLISFPGVYKIDIQQGNAITQEMVNRLKPGMSKAQVSYVMGAPLLESAFNQDRWDYIYSVQAGGKERTQKTFTIFFSGDRMSAVQGDFLPVYDDD